MNFLFSAVVQISILFGAVRATDPFQQSIVKTKCLKPRDIKGCSGTLISECNGTATWTSDFPLNKPDTGVFLFTRSNRNDPEFLHECGARLSSNTCFNSTARTIIIIPGYISNVCDMAWQREYKDQFLCRGHYNIILINWDWGNGADYSSATRNVQFLAKQIACVLRNIIAQTRISCSSIYLIGHSLGAHCAGFVSKELQKTGCKPGRITGLDPAGTAYLDHANEPTKRLDKSDADFVDVVHTNGGRCKGFGYYDPLGHADFYPCGGTVQLSCFPYILESLLKGDIYYALLSLFILPCWHLHSIQYYKVSINSCNCEFIGVECNSYADYVSGKSYKGCGANGSQCAVMGLESENYPYKNDGSFHKYYLTTDLHCPYRSFDEKNRQGFPTTPIKGDRKAYCFSPEKYTCS